MDRRFPEAHVEYVRKYYLQIGSIVCAMEVAVALEGNLTDFSLADMLRLLQAGSKTGILRVSHDDQKVVICFEDGQIYFVGDDEPTEPSSARLVRAGIVSEKQLRQARGLMKIQRLDKAGRKLGQVLADEGYVDSDVLHRFVIDQVSGALFTPLTWETGDLRFEPRKKLDEADIGVAVSVDEALEETGKRLEAWSKIRDKVPSMDTRFAMAPSPGATSSDIHLKPKEWMMLCHLHGGRSVAELVELTGYNEFETARVLYGMHANGLVIRVDEVGEPLPDE